MMEGVDASMHATLQYLFITPCYLIMWTYSLLQCYWKDQSLNATIDFIPLGFQETQMKLHMTTYNYVRYSIAHMNRIKVAVAWCLMSKQVIDQTDISSSISQ
jgi:hypothetical protein